MATTGVPKSGAVSKGYNFASTRSECAVDDQQKDAILALSPRRLKSSGADLGKEGSLSVSPDGSSLDDAGVEGFALHNTHQVRDAIEQELPKVMAKMKLYLQNQTTRFPFQINKNKYG